MKHVHVSIKGKGGKFDKVNLDISNQTEMLRILRHAPFLAETPRAIGCQIMEFSQNSPSYLIIGW
jgi:hypothetical protein